jgi:S1-C subfamily serine protease
MVQALPLETEGGFIMSSSQKHFPQIDRLGIYGLVIFLGIALTIAAIRVFPDRLIPNDTNTSSQVQRSAPTFSSSGSSSGILVTQNNQHNFVVAAVKRVGAAVVRIDTEKRVATNFSSPFFDNPFLRDFLGEDIFSQLPQEYRLYGEGSGFIIDSSGLILTNAHVVSGVDKVTVTLKDGRTSIGKVRGIDNPSDLAVVKIDGSNLPIAPLGKSKNIKVGDWAIAVGNPLGLDNTVTLGIISTLNRSSTQVGIPDKRIEFIQTDAAINPGNSGGPLLNERGEVIGINTAIRAGAEGIGFAIPIDTATAIKDRLARGERIPHPYIGIRMLTLTTAIAKQINADPNEAITVPEIDGVLVLQVTPNSPAAKAGLRQGDIILAIDERSVTNANQLQIEIANSRIGQQLRLKVQRGDRIEELAVSPGELENAANF